MSKKHANAHVHSGFIHNSQKAEATHVSVEGGMGERHVVRTRSGVASSSQRRRILTYAAAWRNLEDTVLGGMSQSLEILYDPPYPRHLE